MVWNQERRKGGYRGVLKRKQEKGAKVTLINATQIRKLVITFRQDSILMKPGTPTLGKLSVHIPS